MNAEQIKEKCRAIYDELITCGTSRTAMEFSYIAGGAIVSMFKDEEVKDFDIWFRSKPTFDQAVSTIDLEPKKVSRFSHTYILPSGIEIQFVQSRIGCPRTVCETFDFKHTMQWYIPQSTHTKSFDETLKLDEELLASRELIYNKGKLCHPVNTVQRVVKFVKRGYWISQESVIDLMLDVRSATEESIVMDRARGGGSR